ncbi:GNAT family N-acetyltransferase [Cytobacillus praedii]|uniref:GNAT family N-acetyltransferase n=1 Tax=Cytobacillus praedii TaxID=1742358 RepID=A0A4R1AP80_9BACI|nr:GNAT family N-acetyltransferase [Cytobacillus praedii]TCJ01702.1 GNAT family N-acetyltransferase [Cytobacillus praedii]
MLRIIKNAENEATADKVLMPIHLLIACLQEKTGLLGEISLKCELKVSSLRALASNGMENSTTDSKKDLLFNVPVSKDVQLVFQEAAICMKNYNQVFVNEGHLLKALLTTKVIDQYLSEEDKKIILNLGTTSRDMVAHLGEFNFPLAGANIVRRVNNNDYSSLLQFVEANFSSEWSQTLKDGFLADAPSIYIAVADEEIIGFAAFDVYKGRKCYFGPMGVSKSNRIKGVGTLLLHQCLREMKEIGYEYAIIGGAGPIEFYEKACHAVVIPHHRF